MKISRHNIISPIEDSDKYISVNLLHGTADILDKNEYQELIDQTDTNSENEEKAVFEEKYKRFKFLQKNDEVQLFFVPTYNCNFKCSYCFQSEFVNDSDFCTNDVIDGFFDYILKYFAYRKKYITIFGGEPLLNTAKAKTTISYIIEKSNLHEIDLSIVTNGYNIEEYIDLIKKARIREVQVTLDGTADAHNKRRPLKGGQPTFDKIAKGVDLLLKNFIPVNLRMVADKDNIDALPDLAQFAIDKNWTKNKRLFKTQVGRNYDLHTCSYNDSLYSRIEINNKLYQLINEFPHILEFYKPPFGVMKHLKENGVLPEAVFDGCPACKNEWAFDLYGTIYSCTATVGKKGEELGTFYPETSHNTEIINDWQQRDITTINECKNCSVALICGGGCGSVAKNKNKTIFSTDCRPIKELTGLGTKVYFNNEIKGEQL